ncbi:MAG TPA: heme biosynthesis HemY N-terminal domain-containing protein [Steroidobacteraceae bacterium]|nr:heme biosynthesis HemY N-terminal domain-containing protein [Steroidobacteraceae bacterium]
MKRLALLVAALIIGAKLANTLLPENGYVAISFRGYLIEMSVPTLVLCIVLTLVALEALQRLLRWPREQRALRLARRRTRAREDLNRGLLEMSAGRWSESELTLTRSARDADLPAVHYLAAARAADLQNAYERRDAWLALAREAAPDEPGPVLITVAEMNLKSGNSDAALEALASLEQLGALNPRALLLLARVYRQRGDFDRLRQLEPRLRNTRGVTPSAVDEIMDTLYADMLKVATDKGGVAAVEAVWDEATRAARRRPGVVVAYARGLARFGEPGRAADALKALLEAEWNEAAVLLYGELGGGDPLERLRTAEGWLKARREDPALLVSCARLCLNAELYGKARSYLEMSQALKPRAETAQLLAQLLEQLGDTERAVAVLKQGIALVTGKQPVLPPLKQRRFGVPRR